MNLEVEIHSKLEGRYNLIVRDAKTLEVKRETGWFKNLILNQGLDRMASSTFMTHAQVGTSNVAPAVTQTALQGYLAGTSTVSSTTSSAQASAPYYGKLVRVYRFAAGVATGTLAEVGVAWTSTTGNVFSRALITDADGNPTTITVLADEVLDVVYELRQYPDLVDKVFQAVISGVTYDCVLRAAIVTGQPWYQNIDSATGPYGSIGAGQAFNGALGGITVSPSGLSDQVTATPTMGAYTNGTYFRTMTSTWGLDDGNLAGGITAVMQSTTRGAYKMSFSPPVAKDNTKVFTLVTKHSWARHTI